MEKSTPELVASDQPDASLGNLSDQTVQFEYEEAGVTLVRSGQIAGWRTLPFAVVTYIPVGAMRIERADGTSIEFGAREAICIPPGVRHRSVMRCDDAALGRWVHFNIRLFGYIDVFSLVDVPDVLKNEDAQLFADIIDQLVTKDTRNNPVWCQLKKKALKYELAALITSRAPMKFGTRSKLQQLDRLVPVLDYIHQHLAEDFSRDDMAAVCRLSSSRFAAVFKETLGISFIDYVTNLRMQRARQLLISKDYTVAEISAQIGYVDAGYFSRVFKNQFGISPMQYRDSAGSRT